MNPARAKNNGTTNARLWYGVMSGTMCSTRAAKITWATTTNPAAHAR